MTGTLVQLNTSPGGVPKLPIPEGRLTLEGIAGDGHRDLRHHGGPTRAICLYSVELYDLIRDKGIDVPLGAVGENFSTRGIDLQQLVSGDRLKVGECMIEITTVRQPCRTLKVWASELPELMVGRSGWYAKVIQQGTVWPGDAIEVLAKEPS